MSVRSVFTHTHTHTHAHTQTHTHTHTHTHIPAVRHVMGHPGGVLELSASMSFRAALVCGETGIYFQ